MMINNPVEYRRKAQEWAVRFAGAPNTPAREASSSGSAATPAPRVMSEEQRKMQEYGGYDEAIVERFTGMGFPVRQVVRSLSIVGIRKRGNITETEAERVVEMLLS